LNCDDKLTLFDSKDDITAEVVGYDPQKIKDLLEKVRKEFGDTKN
jgi:hypothetical protein